MTIKLAVLISGSYRNFDVVWQKNRTVIENLGIPYEVFFHTWSQNPSPISSAIKSHYRNEFIYSIRKPIFTRYKFEVITEQVCSNHGFYYSLVEDFSESDVCKEFNLLVDRANFLLQSQINSCGMYLGIEKMRLALSENCDFTHFLRLRTDFELDSDSLMSLFDHDLVFFGQLLSTKEGPIGDQCFGGNIKNAAGVLSTLDVLKDFTSSSEWKSNPIQGLGETIIQIVLNPMRKNLKMFYAEGKGQIRRSEISYVSFFQQPFYCIRILFHNIHVLIKKIRSKVNKLI